MTMGLRADDIARLSHAPPARIGQVAAYQPIAMDPAISRMTVMTSMTRRTNIKEVLIQCGPQCGPSTMRSTQSGAQRSGSVPF